MKKIHKLDENGFALLTVFLIGTISLALVSLVFVLLTMSTRMSGQDKRYLTELEAAKGASEFIMASLRDVSLTCNSNATCTAGNSIDLHGSVCTAMGKPGCNGLSATYLSESSQTAGGVPTITVVAVEVTSTRANGPEKAIVQFVYKIY